MKLSKTYHAILYVPNMRLCTKDGHIAIYHSEKRAQKYIDSAWDDHKDYAIVELEVKNLRQIAILHKV